MGVEFADRLKRVVDEYNNCQRDEAYANEVLDDVAEQLNIKLPCDEYDTFGGYVFATLGRIADDGTTFSIETDIMNIDVLEIRDHRIETTVVRLKEQPQGDDSDSDKD